MKSKAKTWLILDCPYLCHRIKHAMNGSLTYAGRPVDVIYTFLKEIVYFQEQFKTGNIIFCWDSKKSLRKKLFPDYKSKRHSKELTTEEMDFEIAFHNQMYKLRKDYLPTIGYKNIWFCPGYESDDLIAKASDRITLKKDTGIIIASDHDLYQCITKHVNMYNPQSKIMLTLGGFRTKFGIVPTQWAIVKSIAGCNTDNVPGVKGVGEITAIKYILGQLKPTTKVYGAIKASQKIINRNWELVFLPYQGTPCPKLKEDELSLDGWRQVVRSLGMKSLDKNFNPFPMKE